MAANASALWLTGNASAARWLRRQEDDARRQAGARAWDTPAILALPAWLERVWSECGDRALLSDVQEQWLWEQPIAADAAADAEGPLDVAATAGLAAGAWQLAQAWLLPWEHESWEQSRESARFRTWARQFAAACRERGSLSRAELTGAVAGAIAHGAAPAPARVRLLGFDELTPAQEKLIAALRAAGSEVERAPAEPAAEAVRVVEAPDAAREWELAARWAEKLAAGGDDTTIGVVVPELSRVRSAVENVFEEILHAGRALGGGEPARFRLSLGMPLARFPVVAAALALLEWCLGEETAPFEQAAALAQSPFLAGAESEMARRAGWQRKWARRQWTRLGRARLAQEAAGAGCPVLAAVLNRADALCARWPARQSHRGWAEAFAALLEASGWPGERPLTSAEFQAAERWSDALDALAALDAIAAAPVGAAAAVRRLRQILEARLFQPAAAAGARPRIEVLGWLEAAGLRFDHLWVTGLHDGALPQPVAPHPLLPRRLQVERGLPHATPAREAAFAANLWERLRRSGSQVVASYPGSEGDRRLRPSPLLAAGTRAEAGAGRPPALPTEALEDHQAPPAAGDDAGGAVRLLEDQAACPFRAFAHHRLHASGAPAPPSGLAPTTRGSLLHRALEMFWSEVAGHGALAAMTDAQREQRAAASAEAAVQREPLLEYRPGLAALEQERLTALLLAWLPIELERQPPFAVTEREMERTAEIAGLQLRLRLDRVDTLEGEAGGRVLVDYKSGEVKVRNWDAERLRAPQLPVYLLTDPEPESVTAIAFACLKPGKMGFHQRPAGPAELAAWREALDALAREYLGGSAGVQPSGPEECRYCDLHCLCRIAESRLVAPALAAAEDAGDA